MGFKLMCIHASYHIYYVLGTIVFSLHWQCLGKVRFCLLVDFRCFVDLIFSGHAMIIDSFLHRALFFINRDDIFLIVVFRYLVRTEYNLVHYVRFVVGSQWPILRCVETSDVELLIDRLFSAHQQPLQNGCGQQWFQQFTHCMHGLPTGNFVKFIPWDKVQRVGEASNPGPVENTSEEVTFSLIHPTGLYNKDDLVVALGPGTYSVAETHATYKVQQALKQKFRKKNFNVVFGKAVPSHLGKDNFKGIASGVACVSSFPTRLVPLNNSEYLFDSCRIVATHVYLGPNITVLVITIYAPPRACVTLHDPKGLTIQLLECAYQMANSWFGPVVIMGDFNHDILNFEVVQTMFHKGWADGQSIQGRVHGTSPMPTCVLPQGTSCHSNILISPQLVRSFSWCRTVDESFCGHPVLSLACRLSVLKRHLVVWGLPKPFLCHHFDKDIMEQSPLQYTEDIRQLENYTTEGKLDEAAHKWSQITEQTLASGARDVHNVPIHFNKSHFNRGKDPRFRTIPLSKPACRIGRHGDQNATTVQGPTWHRQHLRQLRRLQTLVCLSTAFDRNPNSSNERACDELWDKISKAPGFRGFPNWVVTYLHLVFPLFRPPTCDIEVLHEHFAYYFKQVDCQVAAQERREKQEFFSKDWDVGGKKTFASIREEPIDPVCFVAKSVTSKVKKIRWPKQGLQCIPVDTPHVFAVGLPVNFQGQHSNVTHVTDHAIHVTPPLCLGPGH